MSKDNTDNTAICFLVPTSWATFGLKSKRGPVAPGLHLQHDDLALARLDLRGVATLYRATGWARSGL